MPLSFFPGVPIFFFISGFLIFQSWENIQSSKVKIFFTNRFLRLYPALYLCVFLTLGSVLLSGYLTNANIGTEKLLIWLFTQLTCFQFYNPDFLRSYGVGAINGSLWTISVELQFYLLIPLVAFVWKKNKKVSILLFGFFLLLNVLNSFLNQQNTIIEKLISVSFFPWIYMFLFGAYLSTNKSIQEKILKINWLFIVFGYFVVYYFSLKFNLGAGNSMNPVAFLFLSGFVFKVAYFKPHISDSILKKNDISYGVYIYHMPIVNFFLYKQFAGSLSSLFLAFLLTIIIAFISWKLVEKPALNLKKTALRRYL